MIAANYSVWIRQCVRDPQLEVTLTLEIDRSVLS